MAGYYAVCGESAGVVYGVGGGVGVGELLVRLRHDLAVDLDGRRKVGGDEEVGPVLLEHQLQQVVHELECLVAFHGVFQLPGGPASVGNCPG